jgi:acyl-CoA synthetase (AMP-forming)/AMP-acid ligase II
MATAHVLVDGWLRTDDLGRVDGSGCLTLAGRSGDRYVRGGENVHPAEVEAVLSSHPAVGEVAVVERADPVMGEVGVAVVVPVDAGAPPSLAELRDHAAASLAAYKLPADLRIVTRLPLTAMHKIDRGALRRDVAAPPAD